MVRGDVEIVDFAAMTFTPNGAVQAYVGGAIDVSHQLCNNGNQVASGAPSILSTHAKSGWTNVVVYDANGNAKADAAELSAGDWPSGYGGSFNGGECISVVNRVFTPLGVSAGETNTVELTATGVFAAATVSQTVSDFVTVISGDVSALKEQQVVDCLTPTLDPGSWTTDALAAQEPGTCIAYRVTAWNIGSRDATGLTISDTVPAYTTLLSGSVIASGVAAIGSSVAPDITATAATMKPGEKAVLTFVVQINE